VGTLFCNDAKKTLQGSLTGAGFDVGDLRLCRFREFMDGLRRDDVSL